MADDLLARFEALAADLGARGCTQQAIEAIESDQGVTLPRSYLYFLATMGRDDRGLWDGSEIGFPAILGARPNPEDLPGLPSDAALLMNHQGYEFTYVRAVEGDDPPVYCWSEAFAEGENPRPMFGSILEFLVAGRRGR